MLKKTMLVVLVIVLLIPSVLSISHLTIQKIVTTTVSPDPSVLVATNPSDLQVELVANVPAGNLKKDDTFWVDIYITPTTYTTIGATTIQLKTSATHAAAFNGQKQDGEFSTALGAGTFAGAGTVAPSLYRYGSYSTGSGTSPTTVVPGRRYLLGRLQMKIPYTAEGNSFEITLQKDSAPGISGSSAVYTVAPAPIKKYNLVPLPTKIVKTSFCVPKTVAQCLTLACGKATMDDGCGGKVECIGSTLECAPGLVCMGNNKCVTAVSQVLPASAPPKDTSLLTSISMVLNQACDPNTPVFICNSGKIDAIVTALIAWFN